MRSIALAALLALAACRHEGPRGGCLRALPNRCDGTSGLAAPLPVCSERAPCVDAVDFSGGGLSRRTITTASDRPVCAPREKGRPPLADGDPFAVADPSGTIRFACLHRPPGAAPGRLHPLVLFFHGAGGDARGLYDRTLLGAKADQFGLGGDPSVPGFVLMSLQGRNLHWPSRNPPGRHWDHYFRDPDGNPDVWFADRLIDQLVEAGGIDPKRIYAVGWSNGGRFAQFYGIARRARPTPGGNLIAAAVSFAGADPFAAACASERPGCAADPYPKTDLPILVVARACDSAMGCDDAQAARFDLAPGSSVEAWFAALTGPMADANARLLLVDADARKVERCASSCGPVRGLLNHVRWPDGVDDGSGADWEPEMLRFLGEHPLP